MSGRYCSENIATEYRCHRCHTATDQQINKRRVVGNTAEKEILENNCANQYGNVTS